MSETAESIVVVQQEATNNQKSNLYKNPEYVSLYRYENPSIPYETWREGFVSKQELIGSWYTDNLHDLNTYMLTRVRGQEGGRYVVVRIPKEDLLQYDASVLPETKGMDIEKGNYIIPQDIAAPSRVEREALFKETWKGKRNIPFTDWTQIENDIQQKLTDQAIIAHLENLEKNTQ